jgi:hypothetical protein
VFAVARLKCGGPYRAIAVYGLCPLPLVLALLPPHRVDVMSDRANILGIGFPAVRGISNYRPRMYSLSS